MKFVRLFRDDRIGLQQPCLSFSFINVLGMVKKQTNPKPRKKVKRNHTIKNTKRDCQCNYPICINSSFILLGINVNCL